MSSRPAHGRVVKGVWRKAVRGSSHMLRKPLAWAMDVEDLVQAVELGAESVVIRDTENGRMYRASIDLICRKGFLFDRGSGEQLGLPLRVWDVVGYGTPGDGPHREQARQLALPFSGGGR